MDDRAVVDGALTKEASAEFLGRWSRLVSTTNWEKGHIINEWRQALISMLKVHDFALIEENNVLRVVKLAESDASANQRIPLLVHLRHADPGVVRQLLEPMLSPEGRIFFRAWTDFSDTTRTLTATPPH